MSVNGDWHVWYRLWTDDASRKFVAEKFPELLRTWDAYPFAIQRADVIR